MKAVEAVKENFYCFLGIVHPTYYQSRGWGPWLGSSPIIIDRKKCQMKKDNAFVCPSITEIPKCQTSIFSIMVWVWDCPDKRSPGQEPSPSVKLFLAYWSVLQIHCCLSEPWKPNKERHHEHKKVILIHSVWVTQAPYMPQWVWKFHSIPLLAGIEMQMPSSGPSIGVRARYWCRGMRDGWAGPG